MEGRGLRPMDKNGLADVYAVVRCGKGAAPQRTKPVAKSLEPQWGADDGWFEFEDVKLTETVLGTPLSVLYACMPCSARLSRLV